MSQRNTYHHLHSVTLFQQGNEKGLAYIFNELFPFLCFYANQFIKNRQAAEDIVSVAFTKTWKHHKKLDTFVAIKSYLMLVVKRDCIRELKKDAQKKIHPDGFKDTISEASCFNKLVTAETIGMLHDAIEQLSPGMKAVMVSMYVEGNSLTETAKILKLNTSTVDTQKKRGIQALIKLLCRKGLQSID